MPVLLAVCRQVMVKAERNVVRGGWDVDYGGGPEWLSDTEFRRRFDPVGPH